jgi:predicted transposase YdaD
MVHTSGLLLLGMRYLWDVIQRAYMGVHAMKESTSYQAILAEGREDGLKIGRQEGRQEGSQEGVQVVALVV